MSRETCPTCHGEGERGPIDYEVNGAVCPECDGWGYLEDEWTDEDVLLAEQSTREAREWREAA